MSKFSKPHFWIGFCLFLGIEFSACTLGNSSHVIVSTPDIISTLAEQTVEAEILQTTPVATYFTPTASPSALAVATSTATSIPAPTNTPAPPPTLPPVPITILSIHMLDSNTGWGTGGVDGNADHVLKTGDGGLTWQNLTPPEPPPANSEAVTLVSYYLDQDHAWVIFGLTNGTLPAHPVVWRTSDGGQKWKSSQNLDVSGLNESFNPSDLIFVDEKNGWLMAHVGAGMNHDYVVLYKTSDGGENWTRLVDPNTDNTIQSCYKNAILFTNKRTGWLTGTCNGVIAGVLLFQTADGGTTWSHVDLPEPASAPGIFTSQDAACSSADVRFFSEKSGVLAVTCAHFSQNPPKYDYFLFSTTNGGVSWSSKVFPGSAITFLDEKNSWSTGKSIFVTHDGGQSWAKLSTVTWEAKFDFIDQNLGWAIARSGDLVALVKTTNSGKSWIEITPSMYP